MQILGWSPMELIEMTRKRTRKSLPRFLARHQQTRPRLIRNAESTGYDICRRLRQISRENPAGDLVVRAAPDVIDWFLAGKDRTLEGWLHRRILWEERESGDADSFEVFARK